MFEYSKIILNRKLLPEDVINVFGSNEAGKWKTCYVETRIQEFSFVNKGDTVVTLKKFRWSNDGVNVKIASPVSGYVRYPKYGGKVEPSIGETLFYISENNDISPENWDISSVAIKEEEINGKIYYSLTGFPKKYLVDTEFIYCRITVTDNEPKWEANCEIFLGLFPLRGDVVHSVQFQEPFKIKLKYGQNFSRGVSKITLDPSDWETEADGEHCCLKYFAIGYPPRKAKKAKEIKTEEITKLPKTENSIRNCDGDACFVYMMKNNNNGYYKIGISKTPEYREKTLQSQEPDITIVFQMQFPSREIARTVERAMHIKYDEFRLRGEWFSIPSEQINLVAKEIVMLSI